MTFRFHPEALGEYQAAAFFYSQEVSEVIALSFLSVIEGGIFLRKSVHLLLPRGVHPHKHGL